MIDRRNILLLTLVILIASVIGIVIPYLLTKNKSAGTPDTTRSESRVKIDYDNSGFVPKSITVRAGTTVSWTNNSDRPMWVASDPHPSHTALPGFDEEGTILPNPSKKSSLIKSAFAHTTNNTYSYTFLKTGKWKYHNHIFALDRGEIIVTK